MSKIVYCVAQDQASQWLCARWSEFVDFEIYNPDQHYPAHTVMMYNVHLSDLSQIPQRLAHGHRVIVDNANEHYTHIRNAELLSLSQQVGRQICWIISGQEPAQARFDIVATPYWYWIADQENLLQGNLNQQRYRPTGQQEWLCTMNLQRPERDLLYNTLTKLDRPGLISYRARGCFLPDDHSGPAWQRRINADWLQQTYYTIVPESYVQDYDYRTGIALTERNDEFICEKTLKPLAAQHPFLLLSTRGNLQHVRNLGFETFPELFDETYDLHFRWNQRFDAVIEQVKQFDRGRIHNPRVQDKLRHNQDRFFDRNLVGHFFATTVAEPVLRWINET